MKHLFLSSLLLFFIALNAQNSAIEYLESINKEYQNISKTSWDYTSTISHGSSTRKAEQKRKKLVSAIDDAKKNISILGNWNGSSAFKDSVINYLDVTYKVMISDYPNLMDLEDVAEQSYDAMEKFLTIKRLANEKLAQAQNSVQTELENFCEQNDIELVEDESDLSKKIKMANDVYDHYNDVYLAFFKANIQEAVLMNAIQLKDSSAIEQNRNALKQYAEEGLEKIKNLKAYKGDGSLLTITRNLLNFYIDETEKEVPFISDFYMEVKQFEKLSAAINSNKNRTQKDIDEYNKQVAGMNEKSNQFNQKTQLLDTNRSKLIDQWNTSAANFITRHVPK